MNNYVVGNVLSIDGLRISIIMRQNTNMLTYFYDGDTYRGVSIGEYIGIIRGPYKIVARVEKEYLNDKLKDKDNQTYSLNRFERIIEVSVIGSFYGSDFEFGIKCLPMIFNEAVLLREEEVSQIIGNGINKNNDNIFINIGNSIQENIRVEIPVGGLFNSHIGIFGNTGSGKSNTLAKLYTELLNHNDLNIQQDISRFIILDFNGEYIGDEAFCHIDKKQILKLSTRDDNGDKIKLHSKHFWNKETLSILFSATEKTQQPFVEKTLSYYLGNDKQITNDIIIKAILSSLKNTFSINQHKESLNLLKRIYKICNIDDGMGEYQGYKLPLYSVEWNNKYMCYWENNKSACIDSSAINEFKEKLEESFSFASLSLIDRFEILVYSQLIFGLAYNHFQFEHISPLISRIEASRTFIEKTITIDDDANDKLLTIFSFKDCNQDAKKVLPLLISKQLYNEHIKTSNKEGAIAKTCHLIIDEAHNILSEQSTREADSFKDYRLDVFEQIIKEGRKFGFYLTISSQRPYDISPTIISQLHNYFIHRLVNDMDLHMLAHTISTLDGLSKARIPNLSPGQCILTGTLFDLPLLIQVRQLNKEKSPNSDNANLLNLWKK